MGQHPQEFFANDFEKALYDDEDTMMGSMLLLHASNCSSMSAAELGENHDDQTLLSCRDEYAYRTSSDEHLEIQTFMEPSFEVALMESIAPDSVPLGSQCEGLECLESSHVKQSNHVMSAEEVMLDLEKELLATCHLERKCRYDHDGHAFIHIYDQGLSTLLESPSFLEEASPRAPPSKMMTIQPCISDDQKLQARWELAKHDFEQEGKEAAPLSPCRSPSHSRRVRMWLKALL